MEGADELGLARIDEEIAVMGEEFELLKRRVQAERAACDDYRIKRRKAPLTLAGFNQRVLGYALGRPGPGLLHEHFPVSDLSAYRLPSAGPRGAPLPTDFGTRGSPRALCASLLGLPAPSPASRSPAL